MRDFQGPGMNAEFSKNDLEFLEKVKDMFHIISISGSFGGKSLLNKATVWERLPCLQSPWSTLRGGNFQIQATSLEMRGK
uniref:Uncharacterized protein n=1 Tax=Metallosphaera hakonensis JCM 8857 = DSM 7519 TaxID=1293036 RepID=A0A2U9IRG0_9CREN